MRNRSCKGLQSERLSVLVEYCRIQWEWITGFAELTAVVDVYYNFPAGCSGCCGCCSFFFCGEFGNVGEFWPQGPPRFEGRVKWFSQMPSCEAPWSTMEHHEAPRLAKYIKEISRRYQGDIKNMQEILRYHSLSSVSSVWRPSIYTHCRAFAELLSDSIGQTLGRLGRAWTICEDVKLNEAEAKRKALERFCWSLTFLASVDASVLTSIDEVLSKQYYIYKSI